MSTQGLGEAFGRHGVPMTGSEGQELMGPEITGIPDAEWNRLIEQNVGKAEVEGVAPVNPIDVDAYWPSADNITEADEAELGGVDNEPANALGLVFSPQEVAVDGTKVAISRRKSFSSRTRDSIGSFLERQTVKAEDRAHRRALRRRGEAPPKPARDGFIPGSSPRPRTKAYEAIATEMAATAEVPALEQDHHPSQRTRKGRALNFPSEGFTITKRQLRILSASGVKIDKA